MSQGMALTAGSHAAQARKPRQVRKEATVSDVPRAPWECLARATADDTPPGRCQREVLDHFSGGCLSMPDALPDTVPDALPDTPTAPPAGRRPRKSLGQHFLTDGRVANRIVAAAAAVPSDVVLEVGPGAGILTRRLVERAGRVIAVELDPALAGQLGQRLGNPANLNVVHGDARRVDIAGLVGPDTCYKVVANLPYYAAAPIIRRFLESPTPPSLLVVMVQREVAAAMAAAPGAMTLLSVATQFYAVPSVVAQVRPKSFRPPPKVSSTVVKLAVRPAPAAAVADAAAFFALARAGFAAPRKQLRNSLMQGTGADAGLVAAILADAGIDAQRRPATLTIDEWAMLNAVWPDDAPRSRIG